MLNVSSPFFGNNACDGLHCLPVARLMQCIEVKVAIFAFSALNGLAPSYLIDLAVCIGITQTRSSLFTWSDVGNFSTFHCICRTCICSGLTISMEQAVSSRTRIAVPRYISSAPKEALLWSWLFLRIGLSFVIKSVLTESNCLQWHSYKLSSIIINYY